MSNIKLTDEQKNGNPLRVCVDGVPVEDQRAGIEAFKLQCLRRDIAAETMVKKKPLADKSLQTVIDSPNFREYEKEMAREVLRLRATLTRIGDPEFVYSSDDDEDTQLLLRMADARASTSRD